MEAADERCWGTMTSHETVVHVREAFRVAQGKRVTGKGPMPIPVSPGILKFLALRLPLRWRKGIETVPELKIGAPGMAKSVEFVQDRASAVRELKCFASRVDLASEHPMFGKMSRGDWMRWRWLHADHHLRQFGR